MGRAVGGNFLSSSSSTAVQLGATQMSDKRKDGRTFKEPRLWPARRLPSSSSPSSL